jgi:hypothetical protein
MRRQERVFWPRPTRFTVLYYFQAFVLTNFSNFESEKRSGISCWTGYFLILGLRLHPDATVSYGVLLFFAYLGYPVAIGVTGDMVKAGQSCALDPSRHFAARVFRCRATLGQLPSDGMRESFCRACRTRIS